ncbi:folate-binding protein YgfZ [Methylibium sp. Pch-M]|uniref:CAF17-like 4Fe-4S cluster assembly/insertion protein YgfZ n=1 Tax=Methylibium sp. Pch-M TaxID=2082386 RepID=UPI0010116DE8|nr:folate-binding protein YgfZ [Methylibium sp. Pch-M]QAZ41217.1 folate-binding protein YgfZ [Methylibium sp. Pch-M]
MSTLLPSSASVADGAVRLLHSGVIRAAGADAASFLHGQLTNDMTGLGLGEARFAAYCSPKGRMLASFVAFKRSHDEIWLACRSDVLPATLKRLRMFVLRAKAQLSEGGDDAVLLGLTGRSAAAWLTQVLPAAVSGAVWSRHALDEALLVRLPDGAGQARWLWAGPAADADAVLNALPALALDRWDWLEVHSGVAPIVANTVEAFVPQMLNYELVGGVNFQKGCYPGQEIVARSQYRGTIKRRAALVHGDDAALPGQEVFWSGDDAQPSGQIALAAPAPGGGWDALVELKLAALDDGSLHLGRVGGARLQPMALPYVVPRENAA